MNYTIKLKGGVKNDIPVLSPREVGICTDTNEVFIGTETGNKDFFKSVNDKIGDGFTTENTITSQMNALANKQNILTYTSLSQLNLDSSANIQGLIKAMPNNSNFVCEGDINSVIKEQCPVSSGTLIINKVTTARTFIQFVTASNGSETPKINNIYYCNYDTVADKISQWVKYANANDISNKPDYECGTWTPIIIGSTSRGTHTYLAQDGWYQKTGKVVTISCRVQLSNFDTSATGQLKISDLPIATKGNGYRCVATIGYITNLTIPSNIKTLEGLLTNNSKDISIYYLNENGMNSFDISNCSNNTHIILSATYMVD